MLTAKMTSKGQITIPMEVRKSLDLKPGDMVVFFKASEREFAFKAKNRSIMDMEGCIPKPDHMITIEEMNQAVLDHAAELDARTRSDAYAKRPEGEAA